ncbi:MAG: magnesium transporter CorA family protein [Candidatus Margulisiibacteriota bacterium]|jgi:magnesium transporter
MENITDKIKVVQVKDFYWYNIISPENSEIDFLREKFKFHPLDLRDAHITKRAQRPQISPREEYTFLVFLFPIYNRANRSIIPAEIDFFIGPNYLITLHDNRLLPLRDLFEQCEKYEYYRDQYIGRGPAFLLFAILEKLLLHCFPMLDHLAEDNQKIENNIFKNREREMVKEILLIKRNIVNFRSIMQSHRTIIRKLMDLNVKYFRIENYKIYFEQLFAQTKDIWEILDGHKESIDTLQETNESAISFRINDVIKTLTLISVIFLPLTLISSIFGMNIVHIPIVNQPLGFWIILGFMALVLIMMLSIFKSKKWY